RRIFAGTLERRPSADISGRSHGGPSVWKEGRESDRCLLRSSSTGRAPAWTREQGGAMRRSRALVLFGGWVTILAIGSVSERSRAAGPDDGRSAPIAVASTGARPRLVPLLARKEALLFGAFVKLDVSASAM